ncbi:MAG: hypothetical protein IPN19_07695 [Elusimicrobia bacterium]|nr:hypothetical protein [Elusimicrobiota bacterium]
MRNRALPLVGLFLFGVYALPGKVCPTPEGRRTSLLTDASADAVPPCHRRAEPQKATTVPCDQMVCCLVPEAARGFSSPVLLPRSEGASFLAYHSEGFLCFWSHRLQSVPFSAQAPPGASGRLISSFSPRGPPVA